MSQQIPCLKGGADRNFSRSHTLVNLVTLSDLPIVMPHVPELDYMSYISYVPYLSAASSLSLISCRAASRCTSGRRATRRSSRCA